ncbi:MAG: hypothetical protein DRJ57_00085 [Thermoprotei archaeon]|nr:MAG: hypothetical protein DRJ57_00085 [Thermoprotei archaeon]
MVRTISLVDTHEHLEPEESRISKPQDPISLFLTHYLSTDFLVAGLSPQDLEKLRNPRIPWEERWPVFEEWWEYACTTGYGQVIKVAIRELYGVAELSRSSYLRLIEKMKRRAVKGFYKWVLREMGGIEKCILDALIPGRYDPDLFLKVVRFDDLVMIRSREDLARVCEKVGRPVHSLEDLEEGVRSYIKRTLPRYAGVKIGLAYERSLYFEDVSRSDAEYSLKAVLASRESSTGGRAPSQSEIKPLQDYLMHCVLRELEEWGKPVQVHTGIHEGLGHELPNSRPTLMINLFRKYPRLKFVLFHASYPYSMEAAVLAKNYPNVYLDLCWIGAISPTATKRILSEWLDLVPNNKVMVFGGDYIFVEGSYGESRIVRGVVAEVLREKVEGGRWSLDEALRVATRILRENAARLFGIS